MTAPTLLVLPESTAQFAHREAGGKGFNLYLMSREGLPVPPWVVLGPRVWERFASATGLVGFVAEQMGFLQQGVPAATVATAIEGRITDTPWPRAVEHALADACARLGGADRPLAVRSSAADEDSAGHSFAGQMSSFLYVTSLPDVRRCVAACWASAFGARALAYRRENGLDLDRIAIAVILQHMIDPDKAGVMFTCDPLAESLDRYVVSAVYGAGEGLVSGALDADTFWLDAGTGAVQKRQLAHKVKRFARGGSGACREDPVPAQEQDTAALSEAELKALYDLGRKVAAAYRDPQDIEWAIAGGRVHVVQTRPVTTLKKGLTGTPNLWDNSNIVESYGGVTLPLSFTFALRNYHNVYVQFCEILGVSTSVVRDMDYYLGNMLGSINGRVFYNLYNWYKLIGVLPGFSQNRDFMETMMGVRERLSDEIAERVKPHPSWDTWLGQLRKLRVGLRFLFYHFVIQTVVDRFLAFFQRAYQKYRGIDYTRLSSDAIFAHYLAMDREMLSHWKAPIINDFLTMVHFGALRKLTAAWLADLDANVQNDLLAGEGNLESAEPTRALIRLAAEVAAVADLRRLVEATPPEDLFEALNQSRFQEFFAAIKAYIDRFGFRCMSEMKLEEIDLFTDTTFLFVCLKNYLRGGRTDLAAYEKHERALRSSAESAVAGHLKGFRKLVYFWFLKHARKAVRNRENTRFARTRAYGVARSMFQAMGEDLAAKGVLAEPRDVFYLQLDEVYGIHQGTLTGIDLKSTVAARKKEYAGYVTAEPRARFLTRGPVYWRNDLLATESLPDVARDAGYDLRGTPCCPGVVEGTVRVVEGVHDDLNLNGEILVTTRTDPGWVPLYPSVSGLLVERGSLLSHSAIVAREMGLPAIVGIKGLTRTLRTGMRIRMDGKAGTIAVLTGR
jgi:pyruvate,water dikinase